MKGLVRKEKGQLHLAGDLEKPIPGEGEVLVRVRAATLNPYDKESRDGVYDGYYQEYGVTAPVRTGLELAGEVASEGSRFKPGERVYGYLHLITGWKAHAEYVPVPEDYLAPIPDGLDIREAAAMPLGLLTGLAVFEDITPNKGVSRALVLGATGGVGVYALQIAKRAGFHVTAVTGKTQLDAARDLGADEVFDYATSPLGDLPGGYDVILDLSTRYGIDDVAALLADGGRFVPALPDEDTSVFEQDQRLGYLMVMQGDGGRLEKLAPEIAAGKLRPVVDEVYAFDQLEAAFARLERKGGRGRVVLTWPD